MTMSDNNIFTNSGCLTEKALQSYLENTLSETENRQVRAHIQHCELCRDALEGYNNMPNKSVIKPLNEKVYAGIDQLNEKALSDQNNKKRRIYLISSIAATLIIGMAVWVTLRMDNYLASQYYAEYHAGKTPLDQHNLQLQQFDGDYHPAVQSREGTEIAYAASNDGKPAKVERVAKEPPQPLKTGQLAEAITPESQKSAKKQASGAITQNRLARSETIADVAMEEDNAGPPPSSEISSEVPHREKIQKMIDNPDIVAYKAPMMNGFENIEEIKRYIAREYIDQLTIKERARPLSGVVIQVTVTTSGRIDGVYVLNAADSYQEQKLRYIILNAPNWEPAEKFGEKEASLVNIKFESDVDYLAPLN